MMPKPLVSVILPVYNASPYLRDAIDSLLCQTWRNFELLMLDDGSHDHSVEIIHSYRDSRITLLHNEQNCGLVCTLNQLLAAAQGDYIARMDADDISLPQRLEQQVAYMEQHPHDGICGTQIECIDHCKHKTGLRRHYPTTHDEIICQLLLSSALAHPSVIMRASILTRYQLHYRPDYSDAEDYDLWTQVAEHSRLSNLATIGLRYRLHNRQVCCVHRQNQRRVVQTIHRRLLAQLGIHPSPAEADIHFQLGMRQPPPPSTSAHDVAAWLDTLQQANESKNLYPIGPFNQLLQTYRVQYGLASENQSRPSIMKN